VEVLSSDDDGSVHLGGNDGAGEDTATDGDEAGNGALLVCKANNVSKRFRHESPNPVQRGPLKEPNSFSSNNDSNNMNT
jgi:hypothetical protein